MKGGREHRVPLSDRALAIVRERIQAGHDRPFAMSNMAMTQTMRRLGLGDYTVHGFRSTFADWVNERTAYPADLREAALAHSRGDKVEAAYSRSDLFEKRRRLMDDWATFVEAPAPAGKVVALRKASAAK